MSARSADEAGYPDGSNSLSHDQNETETGPECNAATVAGWHYVNRQFDRSDGVHDRPYGLHDGTWRHPLDDGLS